MTRAARSSTSAATPVTPRPASTRICGTDRPRDLAVGTADGAEMRDLHLFVLAGDDDAVRPGVERLERGAIDGVGIVRRAPGNVEAHARVDLRLARGARDAVLRFAKDIL